MTFLSFFVVQPAALLEFAFSVFPEDYLPLLQSCIQLHLQSAGSRNCWLICSFFMLMFLSLYIFSLHTVNAFWLCSTYRRYRVCFLDMTKEVVWEVCVWGDIFLDSQNCDNTTWGISPPGNDFKGRQHRFVFTLLQRQFWIIKVDFMWVLVCVCVC